MRCLPLLGMQLHINLRHFLLFGLKQLWMLVRRCGTCHHYAACVAVCFVAAEAAAAAAALDFATVEVMGMFLLLGSVADRRIGSFLEPSTLHSSTAAGYVVIL